MRSVVPMVAALVPFLAHGATAQRAKADFEWNGSRLVLEHGVPKVGQHTLDALEPGQTWRLGANEASTLVTDAPVITPDAVIPPGSYRVSLARFAEDDLQLHVEGAGPFMAAGGDAVSVPGTLTVADPPSKQLVIALAEATEQKDRELRDLALTITFGAPRLTVPLTMVGTQPRKAKGWTAATFTLPAAWVGERLELAKHTPIATLAPARKPKKGAPAQLHLLLSEREALVIPVATAPTADNGFAPIEPPAAEFTVRGTVAWSEAKAPRAHLAFESLEVSPEGELHAVIGVGARTAEIRVQLP